MNLTVADLIALLEQADPDAEIRIAVQPAWPLRHGVTGIATAEDLADDPDAGRFFWIVASNDHAGDDDPYAPAGLWEIAR